MLKFDAPAPAPALAADSAPVPIPALPGGDLRSDLGITTERYGAYSNRDMVEKADSFWKFYWMTKALNEGHEPPGMRAELDTIDRVARKLHSDKNVSAISAIIKQIRTGLEASDLETRLSKRGVRTASLGWSGGSYDLSRALNDSTGGSKKPIRSGPKLNVEEARMAAAWATRHHKPPTLVERECYQRAAEMTRQLGDTLDDERRQAGEHLIGRDKVVPGAGLGNPYDSMFPSKTVR